MSSRVKVLPETLINQIAAGEVIERPASVVKELVENAIDAKAKDIVVELRDAGKSKIVIRDNGIGMNSKDAELALERHATSKIRKLDDLFEVRTLGFRGEALPSIASISKMTLKTRVKESPEGWMVSVHGGKRIKSQVVGTPKGTEVIIEDLFFNTPARLKFLKTPATELARCSEVISHLAMANPGISFKMIHQGRKIYHYPRTASQLERILAVINEKRDSLLPVDEQFQGWGVSGFVSLPSVLSSASKWTFTFVNGRPIKDRTIMHAISAAYQDSIPRGMFPKVVLFIDTPADVLDVNVHPTKREVRFKNAHFVHQLVEKSIQRALRKQVKTVGIERQSIPSLGPSFQARVEQSTLRYAQQIQPQQFKPSHTHAPEISSQVSKTIHEPPPPISQARQLFSSLNYIGQVKSSYLVCEDEQSLIFIDQHAAHERVMYEKIKTDMKGKGPKSQYLLVPLSLELSQDEALFMQDQKDAFKALGFEIEHFGGKTFVVKAVPQTLFNKVNPELIKSMLAELKDLPKSTASEKLQDKIMSTMACHSARTAKERLESKEVYGLLKSLDALKAAPHCPHGRPFSFSIPIRDIEKKFHR